MDFINCEWKYREAHVTMRVPPKDVTIEDLKPLIEIIRNSSDDMIITVDLRDSFLLDIELIKTIVKLVTDVIEYTKNDNLLRKIQFVGAGFMFRLLYKPVSVAIPKYFRDMIVFL